MAARGLEISGDVDGGDAGVGGYAALVQLDFPDSLGEVGVALW